MKENANIKDCLREAIRHEEMARPSMPTDINARIMRRMEQETVRKKGQKTLTAECQQEVLTTECQQDKECDLAMAEKATEDAKPRTISESDLPITRPENLKYTKEEIALMKRQAAEAYIKWMELELEIAKYNIEQTANIK